MSSWSEASNEEYLYVFPLILVGTCHHHLLLGFGMDIFLIQSIERREWIQRIELNSLLMVPIVPCTCHDHLLFWFGIDILLIQNIERHICFYWFEFLSVSANCSFYTPSSSPPRLLGFGMDILMIWNIERRVKIQIDLNQILSWWYLLFHVHANILSFYNQKLTSSCSEASKEEYIPFDLMVLIVPCLYTKSILSINPADSVDLIDFVTCTVWYYVCNDLLQVPKKIVCVPWTWCSVPYIFQIEIIIVIVDRFIDI